MRFTALEAAGRFNRISRSSRPRRIFSTAPSSASLPSHALEAAMIAEHGERERLALRGIGRRDKARVFDSGGYIDVLDDPLRLRLPESGGLKVSVPRAGGDWFAAFH